jgi:monoamine oxidase
VGAGAAGLHAAHLLESRGHRTTLFEAKPSIGGRLQTVHVDGHPFEMGGEWIDADHERCIALARDLGVRLDPTSNGPRRYHFRTQTCTDETLWAEALQAELSLEAGARELCRNLRYPVWLSEDAANLDRRSLAEFVEMHSPTEVGRWFLTSRLLSDEGTDPIRIGLLGWLGGYLNYLDRQGDEMSALRITGGSEVLIAAMANRIAGEIKTKSILRRLTLDPLTLHFDDYSESFDAVVLTLPPRPLERILFDPPLPPEKRCAIEACQMSPITKIALRFDTDWWTQIGWGGEMQTDQVIQQTWPGVGATLMCYICGDASIELAREERPIERVLESLEALYTESRGHFVSAVEHNWTDDEFAGGGFSNTAPGYATAHMPHISTPLPPIYFAGEHTSRWLGFIEGALESAERVVEELDK